MHGKYHDYKTYYWLFSVSILNRYRNALISVACIVVFKDSNTIIYFLFTFRYKKKILKWALIMNE